MKPECDISYGEEEVAARGGTSMNFGCPFYRSCSCGSIFSIPGRSALGLALFRPCDVFVPYARGHECSTLLKSGLHMKINEAVKNCSKP